MILFIHWFIKKLPSQQGKKIIHVENSYKITWRFAFEWNMVKEIRRNLHRMITRSVGKGNAF